MTNSSDPTEKKQSGLIPFEPGKSGNPAGRPKGSRNKLGEAFIADMLTAWETQGPAVIQRVIQERPQDFLKSVGAILPKEVRIETTSDLTDEQLDARVRAVAGALGIEIGIGGAPGGVEAPQGSQTAH
jgi:hypothetical protein